jgi:hypothetical protein
MMMTCRTLRRQRRCWTRYGRQTSPSTTRYAWAGCFACNLGPPPPFFCFLFPPFLLSLAPGPSAQPSWQQPTLPPRLSTVPQQLDHFFRLLCEVDPSRALQLYKEVLRDREAAAGPCVVRELCGTECTTCRCLRGRVTSVIHVVRFRMCPFSF